MSISANVESILRVIPKERVAENRQTGQQFVPNGTAKTLADKWFDAFSISLPAKRHLEKAGFIGWLACKSG